MTSQAANPGPRDALDEGSVEELAQDSREIHLDVVERRPWGEHPDQSTDVPEDAARLIEGYTAYGG